MGMKGIESGCVGCAVGLYVRESSDGWLVAWPCCECRSVLPRCDLNPLLFCTCNHHMRLAVHVAVDANVRAMVALEHCTGSSSVLLCYTEKAT